MSTNLSESDEAVLRVGRILAEMMAKFGSRPDYQYPRHKWHFIMNPADFQILTDLWETSYRKPARWCGYNIQPSRVVKRGCFYLAEEGWDEKHPESTNETDNLDMIWEEDSGPGAWFDFWPAGVPLHIL